MNPFQENDEWGGYQMDEDGVIPLDPAVYFYQIEKDARLRLYNHVRHIIQTTQNVSEE